MPIEQIKKLQKKIDIAKKVVIKSNKPFEEKVDAILELRLIETEIDILEKALNQK